MSATLKAILDTVNDEIGFERSSNYVQSTDQNIRTLVAVANRSARILRDMFLQDLVRQHFVDLSTVTYDLDMDPSDRIGWVPLPDDFYAYTNDTIYQTGRIDPAQLPTPAVTWAYLISRSGPQSLRIRCRIIQNRLYIFSPDASQQLQFAYISKNPITAFGQEGSAGGLGTSETFTNDLDIWDLDDSLIELDIKWRYKQVKALDWQTDFQDAENYKNFLRGRDSGATTLYPPDSWPYPAEPYTNLWVDN